MHVSQETAAETDARLRRIFREAEVTALMGTWWFEEFTYAEALSRIRPDAVAVIRDGPQWSQLIPAARDDSPREAIRLWSIHFAAGVDNSGFVGWLATNLKRQTGTGLIVICGQNSARGGIFDYYGCPESMAGEVDATFSALRFEWPSAPEEISQATVTERYALWEAPALSLDGVSMRVTSTSSGSVVDRSTLFSFRQSGSTVQCQYTGGAVKYGTLIGTLNQNCLEFAYVQRDVLGRVDAGESRAEIVRLTDGRLSMHEHYRWLTRAGTGVNVFEELDLEA